VAGLNSYSVDGQRYIPFCINDGLVLLNWIFPNH